MEFTEKEILVMEYILSNGEIPSINLKQMFNVAGKKHALIKSNFPNIRQYLESFMTAYHYGMYRGGQQWVSVVSWKDTKAVGLREFLNENGIEIIDFAHGRIVDYKLLCAWAGYIGCDINLTLIL